MPERGIQYNNGEKYSCFECNIEDKSVYVYQIKHPSRSCKVIETIFYKGIMPSETGFRFSSGL